MGTVPKQSDKKPQLFHMNPSGQQSAVNTYAEAGTNTPVAISPDHSYVMEILKIKFVFDGSLDTNLATVQVQLTKRSQSGLIYPNNPDLIASVRRSLTLTTSGASELKESDEIDLTDSGGNGYLFAGRELFLGVNTDNQTTAKMNAYCMVLYRLIPVTAAELVGIATESAP